MGMNTKENKAYWKSRALFFEQQFNALDEKYRLLIDQNHLIWQRERELEVEAKAKREFMDKVEAAYREYQIAFASGDRQETREDTTDGN